MIPELWYFFYSNIFFSAVTLNVGSQLSSDVNTLTTKVTDRSWPLRSSLVATVKLKIVWDNKFNDSDKLIS